MNKSPSTNVRFRRSRVWLKTSLAFAALWALLAPAPSARAAVPVGPLAACVTGQTSFGTIKGRLVWGGSEVPPPAILREKGKADKDPTVCAAEAAIPNNELVVDPKNKGVKFAFAYLVKPSGENPEAVKALLAKAASVAIDQKNCEFLPYATAIHQDQTLVFKSSDPVNHNIHLSPFDNQQFNSMLAPNNTFEKKFVAEKRVIPLTCDIHPWMKGWIMVFDHPFFAVTGDDGTFEIKGVPTGMQNLVIWQAAVGYANTGLARGMPVTVAADSVTNVGEIKLDPAKVKKN
jgi:plastocyanin